MATSDVVGGAAQGAAAGTAVMPGWGTAIGAAVGALSGFMGASSARRAQRTQQRLQRRAQKMLSPERISATARQLTPLFREQIASSLGPTFQMQMARSLGRSGLNDTGIGIQLRNAALAIPNIEAFRMATSTAFDLNKARANVLIGRSAGIQPTQAPWMAGLMTGLEGGMNSWLMGQKFRRVPQTVPDVPGGMPSGPMPLPDWGGAPPNIPGTQPWIGM